MCFALETHWNKRRLQSAYGFINANLPTQTVKVLSKTIIASQSAAVAVSSGGHYHALVAREN
jgi:hypothetical protein